MNDNKDHINNYSAEDIQRYLAGRMLPAEMHALEKSALEDPFLADAIDGMALAIKEKGEQEVMQHLEALKQQFTEKTVLSSAGTPIPYMRWWSAAAAIIVLIGGSIWVYTSFVHTGSQSAYAKQEDAAVPATAPAHADTVAAGKPVIPLGDTSSKVPGNDHTVAASSMKHHRHVQPAAPVLKKEHLPAEENKTTFAPAEQLRAMKTDNASAERPLPDVAGNAAARRVENTPLEKYSPPVADNAVVQRKVPGVSVMNSFNGRVVDTNNQPIAGAVVNIPVSNIKVATDEQGNFNVPAADTTVTVSASAVGYVQQQFRLRQDSVMNQLRLQPASSGLQEVVVTGYGNRRKKSQLSKVMVQAAQPIIGWNQYQKYIDSNKKAPAGNPLVTGDAVISFSIDKRGLPEDFRVERTLAKDYDEEAIRLIREGPPWKLLNGRKTKVTVIIHF